MTTTRKRSFLEFRRLNGGVGWVFRAGRFYVHLNRQQNYVGMRFEVLCATKHYREAWELGTPKT